MCTYSIMHNDDMQAQYNRANLVRTNHLDLCTNLDVYYDHTSRRDHDYILVCEYSRDRNHRRT